MNWQKKMRNLKLEFELNRRKTELNLEEERRKGELKFEEERLKNELKQQIKKREALLKLELACVHCEVYNEAGSVKSSKRITATRSKTEVPFAVCTAEQWRIQKILVGGDSKPKPQKFGCLHQN